MSTIPAMRARSGLTPRRAIVLLLVGLAYLGAQWVREGRIRVGDLVLWSPASSGIEQLFAERRSDVVVRAAGSVARVLADDNDGSRHQRFIVELPSGLTVLVAHNIDLAPRVPLRRGDRVEVKGEYEWNERGGVLHWTHHDPRGRHEGGWIRHDGDTYE